MQRVVMRHYELDADNLPEATAAIRPLLGEYYAYDDTVRFSSHSYFPSFPEIHIPNHRLIHVFYTQPALYALWRSFTRCVYLEPVSVDLDARRGAAGERVGSRTDAVGGEGEGVGVRVWA